MKCSILYTPIYARVASAAMVCPALAAVASLVLPWQFLASPPRRWPDTPSQQVVRGTETIGDRKS